MIWAILYGLGYAITIPFVLREFTRFDDCLTLLRLLKIVFVLPFTWWILFIYFITEFAIYYILKLIFLLNEIIIWRKK